LSTTTVWEAGITCDAAYCGAEFILGEEIIYWYGHKMHPRCANQDAASRREAAGEGSDVLAVALRLLGAGSRIILTRRQLRDLITLACSVGIEPVRKPDTGRHVWYGRMHGWSAARVQAGLSAAEVAGMWLDFTEAGRMPPLRQADLIVITDAMEGTLWLHLRPVTVA
jgi:hypothetical protein